MKRLFIMAALSAMAFGNAFGSGFEREKLSLEEAVGLALKKSENVHQALLDIERAEAQIREAWGTLFPQISGNLQTIRHTKSPVIQIGDTAAPIKQDWEILSSLRLDQVVYSFGRVSHALELAKTSRRLQSKAKEAVEREIRFAVEVAYFNALSARNVLQIAKDSLGNAEKNLQALQKRFQGGRIPRFDNIKMASDIAGRAPVVSDAEKNLKLAYLQLNLLTEMSSNARPVLTTSMTELFPGLQENQLLNKALENPNLEATALAVDIADKQAKLAKAEHYPTIGFFGNITHNGTGMDLPPEESNMFTSTSFGLALNIPIFEGGSVSARHKQAVLEKARAQIELKKQKEQLMMELESSIEEYKTNIQKYVSAKKAAKLARQAYELTRSRFATGGATRNDLNDSERALTNARIQKETALFEIYRNKASIKRFTKKVVTR